MKKEVKLDADNYYKMSEPFESADKANEAVGKFRDELDELRKKYKIRDILLVFYDSVRYEDGTVAEFMSTAHFGNSLNCLPMAAYVYGQEQAEHRERINKMISPKRAE